MLMRPEYFIAIDFAGIAFVKYENGNAQNIHICMSVEMLSIRISVSGTHCFRNAWRPPIASQDYCTFRLFGLNGK